MKVGLLYFLVIIIANTVGAVSGMGGGVLIKPIFDTIGAHSVASVSFYSSVAVLTMSIVSTLKQLKQGVKLNVSIVLSISLGAIIGGYLGNVIFDILLNMFQNERMVLLIQIILTIVTLLFAFVYSHFNMAHFHLKNIVWYLLCGLILGTLASLLGIGGGPINVSLLMLMFSIPIKKATVYSICTIFFSQFTKIMAIGISGGLKEYDLNILFFIIPAAIIGGIMGSKLSRVLSEQSVKKVFETVIIIVIIINLINLTRI